MRYLNSPGGAPSSLAFRLTQLAAVAALAVTVLLVAMAGTSNAAERVVRLTLQPSADACTAWDQMSCSYLEVRNGNAPAPDPATDPQPTFLNMAAMPGPVTVDAAISDEGDVTIQPASVKFPAFPTSLENGLVGTVSIKIQISASDVWTGTYDEATGAMELNAPLGLTFKLNCDPVANALCGGIFGPEGNMGTWAVTPKGPVNPLTTGNLAAPAPPAAYGTDWLGPDAEDGAAFDSNGVGTLINNNLEIEKLDAADCVDGSSIACSNPAIGNLIAPSLNGALGTVYDPNDPSNDRDSAPGAIDMRLTFAMSEPAILESDPSEITFAGMNEDGSQPLGTSSPALSTTLTALDAGDIDVRSIYTDGGDDDDFNVTNAKGCAPVIESGGSCQVRLRFNPSETGDRSSTLYASIFNPVTNAVEQIQLATLSGKGGTLPQGPTGPAGATGPSGPKGKNGPLVGIATRSAVRLRTGKVMIAKLRARGAAVGLKVAKKASIKVSGRKYQVRIVSPTKIGKGKAAKIKVKGSRGAVRALKGRKAAKLKLSIKVSSNGISQQYKLRVRLK